jgi:phosphoglycerate dehydrogenase-like enzyme
VSEPRRLVVNLRDARPLWAIPEWAVREIREAAPAGWEVRVVESPVDGRGDGGAPSAEAVEAVRGAEVYLGWGFPRALFAAAHEGVPGRLRWVHSASAGVGGSLYPEMRASPVVLTNSAGVYAAPIAETVLAMLLHFARGLDLAARAQRERRWEKAPFEDPETPVREVAGATLGIVGFGGIGREVAARAVALGMRVLALKRTPGEPPPGGELLAGDGGLRRLLRDSDYVVLSLPETAATRGLIGPGELALLRRDAVLINVSRGGVLDEGALAEALRAGRLRGAGLDVFREEPLPADSSLWELPGVLVTPHVSGTSRAFWRRQTELILDNLARFLRGETLRNLVDKHAGY